MKITITAAAAALAASMGFAQAAPITTYTDQATIDQFESFATGSGTHGLETRGGRQGTNGDWELGLGTDTQSPGNFNQAQYGWGDTGAQQNFEYTLSSTGDATLIIGQTVLTFSGLGLGNAIEVFAKRRAEITIDTLDGMAVNQTFGDWDTDASETVVFESADFLDGFTMTGTMAILAGGGSRQQVFIKTGDLAAAEVPVPAAGLLFGGVAAAGALRRAAKKRAK
jgi:hypothetical protein